jgi:hydroxymethylpyrimidine pyrophosphatase-like HAD family hydrolase
MHKIKVIFNCSIFEFHKDYCYNISDELIKRGHTSIIEEDKNAFHADADFTIQPDEACLNMGGKGIWINHAFPFIPQNEFYESQVSKDKLSDAMSLMEELNVLPSETAYIGDDIIDIKLLKSVGFSGCPNNSPVYIKNICKWVGKKNGGDGAFREFVEYILSESNLLEKTLNNI